MGLQELEKIKTFIVARLDEREQSSEGAGRLAWLTFRTANNEILYTTAAASNDDEAADMWVVDGREVTGSFDVQVMYDEKADRAEVAVLRKLLELHTMPFIVPTPDGDEDIDEHYCAEDGRPQPCDTLHLLASLWSEHDDYEGTV